MRSLMDLMWSRLVVPVGLVATGFYCMWIALLGWKDPAATATDGALRSWAGMWVRLTRINLVVEGGGSLDARTSYVVVANHLSNYDIMMCLAALPIPIRFLAKKELFKYPLLSQAMRAIGIVEVDRSGSTSAVGDINRQADLVRSRNHSLMIYAEGTRSRDGELKAFKKGAFVIASGSGLPIVPVGISGTRDVVPPGTIRAGLGKTVTVRIGVPLTVTKDVPPIQLRDQTHSAVAALIASST